MDLARILFINPHSYTKYLLIKKLRQRVGADCLVETGTYLGVMALRCSKIFSKVYTIELDQGLADRAKRTLSKCLNVRVLQGDATTLLGSLLDKDDAKNALVFLDAHYSGGETACGDSPDPVLEELKIISGHLEKIKAVVIDDFRSFGCEPGFPQKSALIKALEDQFLCAGFRMHLFIDLLVVWRP
ncbi:MAG: hypothetical protein A3D92_03565 [Bacteroidetes bacterium RIFCSPHIGHO2_02_FULL_44_7]|nr:MAG: hypothetical protein A3D92_03565 [Bacteroidetes bacterium RIFCSPHIGHO2_02_FULL_44_7]